MSHVQHIEKTHTSAVSIHTRQLPVPPVTSGHPQPIPTNPAYPSPPSYQPSQLPVFPGQQISGQQISGQQISGSRFPVSRFPVSRFPVSGFPVSGLSVISPTYHRLFLTKSAKNTLFTGILREFSRDYWIFSLSDFFQEPLYLRGCTP